MSRTSQVVSFYSPPVTRILFLSLPPLPMLASERPACAFISAHAVAINTGPSDIHLSECLSATTMSQKQAQRLK